MRKINKLKIAVIIGTRPEAIKLAPVIKEMRKYPGFIECMVVSTGQHREMLDQIFDIFDIQADIDLKIMKYNQSLEHIASETLLKLPGILYKANIDLMLVQGDTTTAFIAALIGFYNKIRIGHVEAGLRTLDKSNPFPEEINRRLISALVDFNFAPTLNNKANLLKEGIPESTIFVTGNTVIDALLITAGEEYQFEDLLLKNISRNQNRKILVTAHRRENFGEPLVNICQAILELVNVHQNVEFIYPVHLNPNVQKIVYDILGNKDRIHLIPPQEYLTFVNLMKLSYLILTDSGGIQEEAPSLSKPVLVMRATTERPEAVEAGTVKIVGTDKKKIIRETSLLLTDTQSYNMMSRRINPYGDGEASKRIIHHILCFYNLWDTAPGEFTPTVSTKNLNMISD